MLGVAAGALAARVHGDVRLALAVFVLPSILFLTVGFGTVARYAEASSARPLARALPPQPAGATVACLDCFSIGLPFYLGRPVTYITHNGRGLSSNYVRYRLRRADSWPAGLVHLDDRTQWLGRQAVPVYLLTRQPARALLDDIAVSAGAPVVEVHPGWWAVLVPPRARP
jgi:hypothetical protein